MNFQLGEPSTSTAIGYLGARAQGPEHLRVHTDSVFAQARQAHTAPHSGQNSHRPTGRNSAHDPRRSPMSSTKQVYRINFKDVFKVEMNKKSTSDHRMAFSTI